MCCRYLLSIEALREIAGRHGLDLPPELVTHYNIAPGSAIPVVRKKPQQPGHELALLHWGLVQARVQPGPAVAPLVNARAETLAAKPAFRDAFALRRCLIPADGFYEWQVVGRTRIPYLFRRHDGQPFCFAGLWNRYRLPDGAELAACAVITTGPNELMQPIHHRQPLILPEAAQACWLDPRVTHPAALAPLLKPFLAEAFTAVALDGYVNNVRHDDPACLAPASGTSPERDSPQLSFDF
jgi:putative SOS response-associated peptidase YedK